MTTLIKKNIDWCWTDGAKQAFNKLKACFETAPLLRHYDPALPIRIETDALTFALSGIMSQQFEEGQ